MKRLAVYCGSSMGTDPAFAALARALGAEMARRRIGLVYGGGRLGLMGVVADAVLEGGGEVYGVIPQALVDLEVAHTGLTELHLVGSMHERKAKMTELTDAFVAIPGGIGTLDELFEAWSWNALGYHAKPFALLNLRRLLGRDDRLSRSCRGERLHVAGAARAIAGRGDDRRRDRQARLGDRRRNERWSGEAGPGGEWHELSDRARRHRPDPRHRRALLLEPALDPAARRRRRLRACRRGSRCSCSARPGASG